MTGRSISFVLWLCQKPATVQQLKTAPLFSAPSSTPGLANVGRQLGALPPNYVCVSAWNQKGDSPVAIQTYPLGGGSQRRQAKATAALRSCGSHSDMIETPFPTLYWLTCPHINRAIFHLEHRGYISKIQAQICEDNTLSQALLDCHLEYARIRWNSLSPQHQRILLQAETGYGKGTTLRRIREILQFSGISGTNLTRHSNQIHDNERFVPPVKCLHTHYAHYRSQLQNHQISPPLASSEVRGRTSQEPYLINPVGELVHQLLQRDYPGLLL
ncbi:hypothetical protein ACA910_002596 [Epithemia clementina (nom. ined.)]